MINEQFKRKPGRPKKKITTQQQRTFAEEYIKTGNKEYAKEVAGYSPQTNPMNFKSVQIAIEDNRKLVEKKFQAKADEMLEAMYALAKGANSENVRFQAIKDMLDRAGFAPVNKSEIETTKYISSEQRVSRDLIDRLNKLKKA